VLFSPRRAATCPCPALRCPAWCPQNFFLYFYGMCFNFLGLLFVMATGSMRPATMLAGFRGVSLCGGMLWLFDGWVGMHCWGAAAEQQR
jgi:hypothetical protein